MSINAKNIIAPNDFNANDLQISAVKQNRYKKSLAYWNNPAAAGRGGFAVPSPELPLAFTSEVRYFDGRPSLQLSVSFPNISDEEDPRYDPEVAHFYKQIERMGDIMADAAAENPVVWMNKAFKDEAVMRKKIRKLQRPTVNLGPIDHETEAKVQSHRSHQDLHGRQRHAGDPRPKVGRRRAGPHLPRGDRLTPAAKEPRSCPDEARAHSIQACRKAERVGLRVGRAEHRHPSVQAREAPHRPQDV